jgi:beta-mannosidase
MPSVSVWASAGRPLDTGWQLCITSPGAALRPGDIPADAEWLPAEVPGTVASALMRAGLWSPETRAPLHIGDAWYACTLTGQGEHVVRFDGLATLAEVWLDDALLMSSTSMFHAHDIPVTLGGTHRLAIAFRALAPELKKRKPPGRWRPRMIEPSSLRHQRTSLLSFMPGWAPRIDIVGPYRPVSLIEVACRPFARASVRARLDGDTGHLAVDIEGLQIGLRGARIACGGRSAALRFDDSGGASAELAIPDVAKWWPHTHGHPALHEVSLECDGDAIALGRTGFRTIAIDRGVPVFCRGAVWSVADITSMPSDRERIAPFLARARDAGMNMIRVPGTCAYEAQAFHDLCDELGILVWQDFMFANFDYPSGDPVFVGSVRKEAADLLGRTGASPSLAVLCGGSEVYQQGAMLGFEPATYRNALFEEILPAAVADLRPDVPYVVGSPSGGAVPFAADAGVGHYFGVGGYRRPLDDCRRARVRFASECLAFANLPSVPATVDANLADALAAANAALLALPVPRDIGASWDFADVRDHYLEERFGVDPAALRARDVVRYADQSRAVAAEIMELVFTEWRRPGSPTRGGLVLMLQDLERAAGWGVLTGDGEPKSSYFALKRAFAPVWTGITDESVNGLAIHAVNDTAGAIDARIVLTAWHEGRTPVVEACRDVVLPARGGITVDAYELMGRFFDIAAVHRFGEPSHDSVAATLVDRATGGQLAQSWFFPDAHRAALPETGLTVRIESHDGLPALVVAADLVARFVEIADATYLPEDNFFHLAPGAERLIRLAPRHGLRVADSELSAPRGWIRAVNATHPCRYGGLP